MKKDKFITLEMREEAGKCNPVSDAVMQNVGIERMGTCSACGHIIENHFGVYGAKIGYLYVGKCCKNILCAPDANQINPTVNTEYIDSRNKPMVFVTREWLKKLGDFIYKTDAKVIDHFHSASWYPSFENNYNGAYYSINHNVFLSNVYLTARESEKYNGKGFYAISPKQYEAVNRTLNGETR